MKKQSSVLLLVIMMVSFSVTGCNAAESLEHESQIESISQIETMQEDSNFMSSVFDDPEYSYTPNHSYQSYVRYLDGTTYTATNRGLFEQRDGSSKWVRLDWGNVIGTGDFLDDDLFYSVGNEGKKLSTENEQISDVYEGEDIILKITAEKRDTGSQIYLSYQSGYVEGLVLDTEGNVKEVLSMEENYRYESENKLYEKKLENTDSDFDMSLSRSDIDPCLSRKTYGKEYYSWWNSNQSGINIRTLVSIGFENGRGISLELTDFFYSCMVTPWGIVYYDAEKHDDIYLLSHKGEKKKKLWGSENGSFSFINYDEEDLYGILEKDGERYISRIDFQSGEFENIHTLKDKVDKFDVLNGWIYYYNSLDMIERRKISSPEETEVISEN